MQNKEKDGGLKESKREREIKVVGEVSGTREEGKGENGTATK